MEEKLFSNYAEYKKFTDGMCSAYFNNEDLSPYNVSVKFTDKAWEEVKRHRIIGVDNFLKDLNTRVDIKIKEAEERRKLFDTQEEN